MPEKSASKKSVPPCYPRVLTKCLGNLLTAGKTVTAEITVLPLVHGESRMLHLRGRELNKKNIFIVCFSKNHR